MHSVKIAKPPDSRLENPTDSCGLGVNNDVKDTGRSPRGQSAFSGSIFLSLNKIGSEGDIRSKDRTWISGLLLFVESAPSLRPVAESASGASPLGGKQFLFRGLTGGPKWS